MKKLLLATFDYRTGTTDHINYHTLVAVDSTPTRPDHHDVEKAEATFTHWFKKAYPNSQLKSLRVWPAVTELTTYPIVKPEPEVYREVNGKHYTKKDMSDYADWIWYHNLTPEGDETIEEWDQLGRPNR